MHNQHRYSPRKKVEGIVYGIHPVIEAIRAGKIPEKVLLKKGMASPQIEELLDLLRKHQVVRQDVPVEKLNRITNAPHQGVIAYMPLIEYQQLEHIVPMLFEQGKTPLFVALDRITDVRNLGAIARTAYCAGANALIIPSRESVTVTEDAMKTSAGALHHIPVCRVHNLYQSLAYLKDAGLRLVSVTEKGKSLHYDVKLTEPLVLVMGSEDDGIAKDILRLSDERIKIPLLADMDSLNVSVATGVVLYEVIRQRMKHG
ncbi:MAG: 23S rRNA (guanosine(2251)-2'-O)-methyltransferase RlmB [Flavobacteriales bacterium]|nr:23S rRNA (guanosine(2251)-2'-O)-methyltransferase RlmB [Flavobacteriales bacterium]MCZ2443950.1 23S rRNA (guanosine(2251)-2'-O)-methyltransferase RlmB [Flavobacteriales bacterium]